MKWHKGVRRALVIGCGGAVLVSAAAGMIVWRVFLFPRTFGQQQWYEIQHVEAPAVFCISGHPYCLGVRLKAERYAEYPEYKEEKEFRGEFLRTAQIRSRENVVERVDLPPRWAGAVRMNLYLAQTSASTVIVRECADGSTVYEADLDRGSFRGLEQLSASHLHFVGAFDADSRSRWRFIPAAERRELPLPWKPVCDVGAPER